ncbi:MAG: hypothetical protein ACK58X_10265, partial [Planctomycetota bacterium]
MSSVLSVVVLLVMPEATTESTEDTETRSRTTTNGTPRRPVWRLLACLSPTWVRIFGPNRGPEIHCRVASHHDHFFQVAFGEPEHAVPLLRSALPAPVADAIDWRTLTRQDPT